MINFILGFSITLNIVTIILIIFGYRYIKHNMFVPKIENVNQKVTDLMKDYDNWLKN